MWSDQPSIVRSAARRKCSRADSKNAIARRDRSSRDTSDSSLL